MSDTKTKLPGSVLDYVFDWAGASNGNGPSDWLAPGEVLSEKTITVEPDEAGGVKVDSSEFLNGSTSVLVWLSGGVFKTNYRIHCEIATPAGKIDTKTLTLMIR